MAGGLFVKVSPSSKFKSVTNLYVKKSPTAWQSVADAWVKVSQTGVWRKFYTASTAPDYPTEVIWDYNSSDLLLFQGKYYHFTPTPTTLQYRIVSVNKETNESYTIKDWTTTSNPAIGTPLIRPTTAQVIYQSDLFSDVTNTIQFWIRGTVAGKNSDYKAEYDLVLPKKPSLSISQTSSTEIDVVITAANQDSWYATNRYIVYTQDTVTGSWSYTTGGRGGYDVTTEADPFTATLTGLVAGRTYNIYVLPVTGRSGTTPTNYTGYSGELAYTSYATTTVAPSTPVISNLTTNADVLGPYIEFDVAQQSTGSSDMDYYEYSLNGGVWQQPSGYSYIYLATPTTYGRIYVSPGISYTVKIRATNQDGLTSSASNTLGPITSQSIPGAPTNIIAKSFTANELTIFFTSGSNTQSVQGLADYDSFSTFDGISNYVNISSNTAGKVQLTGANSASKTYNINLRPFSGLNQGGTTGVFTSTTSRTLSGSDKMTISLGNPSLDSSRTISTSWTLSTGSPTYYRVRLYKYSNGSIIATKTLLGSATSVSFTSSDGVDYNTVYYIQVVPYYEYASGVTYEDYAYVTSNITSGANLSAPTITSVTWDGTTWNVYFTGGSGPYYQIYWIPNYTTPSAGGAYDAAGTASPVSETGISGVTAGTTYSWWVRSSTTNLGNTTQGGTATPGTYSDWSSRYDYTVSNLTAPTISTATSAGVSDTLTVSVSGGGPTYQIYWLGNNSTPGNTVTPDGVSSSTTIQDPSGPGGVGTYYVWARSAIGTSIYGSSYSAAPSPYISSWSSVKSFTVSATRTLSFNANGGSGAPGSQTGSDSGSGATITISSTTPTRSGYTFSSWNTASDGSGTNYSAGGSITISSDTTLYAKWTANNLTAPTISSVSVPTSSSGTLTVYFSGGSGPYYQIYWMGAGGDYSVISGYDASGGSSPISTTAPGSSNDWKVAVRSVATASTTGFGPSATVSSWSSPYLFTTSYPIIPTITMGANSGVTSSAGTINWTSTNQASWSSNGTFNGSGTTQTSVSKTGLSASTNYTGTVTVTSSTGHTASANYSLTTSAAATAGAISVSSVSASRTAAKEITGTWSSSRTGSDTSFMWYNTRIRNTSSGATATHSLFTETPRSDKYTALSGTSYRFGIQAVIFDNAYNTYRYSVGTSDMGAYTENSTNINPT